jgi:GDP-4-dehydro-6-deoxy-D-mannose reductase
MVQLDLDARILIVGSGDEYGLIASEDLPIDENTPLRPMNPYSVSKVTQDMLGLQYFLSHDVPVIRVRPFNQFGPGQNKQFVAPAFALQVATIEYSKAEPVMYVGNMDAKRDFTDVRDMVGAYYSLMEEGHPGEVYNAGSGQSHAIQELLDTMLNLTDAPIEVRKDPARVRPSEVPEIRCDSTKLRELTGWSATTSFQQTVEDTLNDWRVRVRQ